MKSNARIAVSTAEQREPVIEGMHLLAISRNQPDQPAGAIKKEALR